MRDHQSTILSRCLALVTFALVATACAGPSTTIEQTWLSQPEARAEPLRNVVTLYDSDNVTMRHAAEDDLARELIRRGMQATPSYAILGAGDKLDDKTAINAKLRTLGYDGVVTMRVVDREQDFDYTAGGWGYPGYGWGGYYGGYYDGWGYTETIYRIEASAYSLKNNQLVWSALVRTSDPDDAEELIDDTTEVVAGQLARRGLSG